MEGIFVTVHGQRFKIPSRIYPLAHPSKITVLTHANTVPFVDEDFNACIDKERWECKIPTGDRKQPSA